MMTGGTGMLTVEELAQHISAYKQGYVSFEEFENWFEDNSSGSYASSELRDPCAAVSAAISEYYFDQIGEDALREELANAIAPFLLGPVYVSVREIVVGKPLVQTLSANRSFSRVVAVA
jgi:hypothetical protein